MITEDDQGPFFLYLDGIRTCEIETFQAREELSGSSRKNQQYDQYEMYCRFYRFSNFGAWYGS